MVMLAMGLSNSQTLSGFVKVYTASLQPKMYTLVSDFRVPNIVSSYLLLDW